MFPCPMCVQDKDSSYNYGSMFTWRHSPMGVGPTCTTVDTPKIGTKALAWLGTSFWSVIIRVDELWGQDVINRYCEWHPVPTPLDQALLIIFIFLKLDKTSRSHSFWGHKNHNGSSPLPQPSQPLPTSDDPPMAPWWWAFHVHKMVQLTFNGLYYYHVSCCMGFVVAPCCTMLHPFLEVSRSKHVCVLMLAKVWTRVF